MTRRRAQDGPAGAFNYWRRPCLSAFLRKSRTTSTASAWCRLSVRELVHHGHKVLVETNAGEGIGLDDRAYKGAGATIAKTAEDVFAKAEMIVKVKEPQPRETEHAAQGPDPLHLSAPGARSRCRPKA